MYVVAELGIADLLADRPMSAAQLAQATGTHERSLYRVLRLLVALGVLREEQDGCFGLTVVGERLRSDVAASMRSWARLTTLWERFRASSPSSRPSALGDRVLTSPTAEPRQDPARRRSIRRRRGNTLINPRLAARRGDWRLPTFSQDPEEDEPHLRSVAGWSVTC